MKGPHRGEQGSAHGRERDRGQEDDENDVGVQELLSGEEQDQVLPDYRHQPDEKEGGEERYLREEPYPAGQVAHPPLLVDPRYLGLGCEYRYAEKPLQYEIDPGRYMEQ